jgi:hypothetical protein
MQSPLEFLLAAALLVALILAFVLNRRLAELRRKPGGGGDGHVQGGGPIPRPSNPREQVEVHVDSSGDALRLRVEPWVVDVTNGKPLRWVLNSAAVGATMRIDAKDPGRWPFPDPTPKEPVPPGTPFGAGNVRGEVGTVWPYSIIVGIDGREVDIDPEIFICY